MSSEKAGSDWIAYVANASMAVTAVARPPLAAPADGPEGYKLAIELVNAHYIWLGMQSSVLTDVILRRLGKIRSWRQKYHLQSPRMLFQRAGYFVFKGIKHLTSSTP